MTLLTTSLVFLYPVPAVAEPANDLLTHQLERLEDAATELTESAEESEAARRLLRHVRHLRFLARDHSDSSLADRIEALELRVRTGKSKAFPRPFATQPSLDKQGGFSGKVTRASDGAPISDLYVQIWHEGFHYTSAHTDSSGNYRIEFLEPGQYFAVAPNHAGYVGQIYDDVPCPGGVFTGCSLDDGTAITVVDQGTTPNIDFALDVGGSISGTVTDSTTGQPLSDLTVELWNEAGNSVETLYPSNVGAYRVDSLVSGNYFVTTRTYGSHRDELWDDLPCPGGASSGCAPTTGTPIAVNQGSETSGVDFALDELGRIHGKVTDGLTGEAISNVRVYAENVEDGSSGSAYTNDSGDYQIGGLHAGSYLLTTDNYWGYEDELFDDVPCPQGACDTSSGTPVAVRLNEETTNIDFELEGGCFPSEASMCLNDDRFRVAASWRTSAGNSGQGRAVELTDDSGYFWFFGSNNIEMVVKVLDACTLPGANNFWVFAGGLTDVEVTLTVTDTRTGQVKTYANPLGSPFQPIQDTSAFDTCP